MPADNNSPKSSSGKNIKASSSKNEKKRGEGRTRDDVSCNNNEGRGFDEISGGSGPVSVSSSVFSSGSSVENSHVDQGQLVTSSLIAAKFISDARGQGDAKLSPLPSPGPGSEWTTINTSHLLRHLYGSDLEPPTGRLEDGKSECRRLPLPHGSPTSPSAVPTPRTCLTTESSNNNLSKWKKGKFLGGGTFGNVFVGFNRVGNSMHIFNSGKLVYIVKMYGENGQMCAIKEARVVADDQTSKECLKQLNQDDEALHVYLEYASGGSIYKVQQEDGPLKETSIQNYTRQILSGLAYLHERKIVHRDIKGANILVGSKGEVKLADFGLAKHIKSVTSTLAGSPYWIAPEVVKNTSGYSFEVDIWSLGCTIIEMATTKPPWSELEWAAAMFKIGTSKDIPEIPEYLSNDAKDFIRECLQREPDARPTASQLLYHPLLEINLLDLPMQQH